MENLEYLRPGGPVLEQATGVFRLGTDAVLLANFARPGSKDRVLDLGTGSGVIPLLLSWDNPGITVTALEQNPLACDLAKRNMERNGRTSVTVVEGDLREIRTLVPTGSVNLTVSNPPYFSSDRGPTSPKPGIDAARTDGSCTLDELCTAAAWATRWGGRFCLVFRPDRMAELFEALKNNGFEPKRLRPVHHSPTSPVNLILLEARRGGNPGLIWEADLYLRNEDGSESDALRQIYRRDDRKE